MGGAAKSESELADIPPSSQYVIEWASGWAVRETMEWSGGRQPTRTIVHAHRNENVWSVVVGLADLRVDEDAQVDFGSRCHTKQVERVCRVQDRAIEVPHNSKPPPPCPSCSSLPSFPQRLLLLTNLHRLTLPSPLKNQAFNMRSSIIRSLSIAVCVFLAVLAVASANPEVDAIALADNAPAPEVELSNTAQYTWSTGAYTPCSATCGSGDKTRSVVCINTASGQPVADPYCTTVKPASIELCALPNCVPAWVVSPWTVCRCSTRTRSVTCMIGTITAADQFCPAPKPSTLQRCVSFPRC